MPLDSSFKSILDDLSDGVLVMDVAGHRVYSNPALNDLVTGNACLPAGTLEPPAYVPSDQRHRYMMALQGTSSLLTLEGSGTASTWLELAAPGRPRLRTRVAMSAFTGPRGGSQCGSSNPNYPALTWRRRYGPAGRVQEVLLLPGTPSTISRLVPDFGRGVPDQAGEKDVLQLLLDGLRVSSIARRLYLSPQTVRNHLKAIFRKLGAHSQVELLDNLRPAFQEERTTAFASRIASVNLCPRPRRRKRQHCS